jgi:alpha-tubulin suppressor-like RCC1 family protein
MNTCIKLSICLLSLFQASLAYADSSSPRLAGYYNTFMAICGGDAYSWVGNKQPFRLIRNARKVAVGANNRYVLSSDGVLYAWETKDSSAKKIMLNVRTFYAGRSGLLIIQNKNSLWFLPTRSVLGFGEEISLDPIKIANNVGTAAVGDSANYYATLSGDLFVKGKAHRGQYGNGRLTKTTDFVKTADDVIQIVAHTGHALILKNDGTVWGTGGNIYGPIGKHGLGDKAVRWSKLIDNAVGIATGSSHSLAITKKRNLWIWGRRETIEPRIILSSVDAIAAGNDTNTALKGGYLWQWDTGSLPTKKFQCPN